MYSQYYFLLSPYEINQENLKTIQPTPTHICCWDQLQWSWDPSMNNQWPMQGVHLASEIRKFFFYYHNSQANNVR